MEHSEPVALPARGIPWWFLVGMALTFAWGLLHVERNGGGFDPFVHTLGDRPEAVRARVPKSESGASLVRGRKVFNTYCVACHQPHGMGIPGQFPPLLGSEWVLAAGPNRVIRIVLNGLQGPMTVRGQEYNNIMLPWRDQMSDEDIASVLTFIRRSKDWAHQASAVTPALVKSIRDATASRGAAPWTSLELLAIPDSD